MQRDMMHLVGIPSQSLSDGKLMVFDQNGYQQFVREESSREVYHGHFEVHKCVAVKRLQLADFDDTDDKLLESKILLQLAGHPNILKYYCTYNDQASSPKFLFIVTELCIGTLEDLANGTYQKNHPSSRIGDDMRQLLLQITRAVAYLHENRIVHRDINPENIFIAEEYGRNVPARMKLADFGQSYKSTNAEMRFANNPRTPWGKKGWRAPELSKSYECDVKVDTFALGLVFGYTLSGGIHPFDRTDAVGQIYGNPSFRQAKINRGEITLTNERLEQNVLPLIRHMLQANPNQRMVSQNILENPFFQ